jgi:hypothetical protein
MHPAVTYRCNFNVLQCSQLRLRLPLASALGAVWFRERYTLTTLTAVLGTPFLSATTIVPR